MVFNRTTLKKMGRPPKNMQKHRMPQADTFESVIRTGGRVKKAKKVFDPSENNPPKKRVRTQNTTDLEQPKNNHSTEITNSLQTKVRRTHYQKKKDILKPLDDFCSVCSKKSSGLIHCQDCNLKVHFSCIKVNYQNSKLLESKWRCDDCKSCATCYENTETGPLITCATCVRSYHYNCHVPNINETNNINWMCTKCSPKLTQFKPSIIRSRRYTVCAKLAEDVAVSTDKLKNSSELETNKNLPNNNLHNIVLNKDDNKSVANNEYEKVYQNSKNSLILEEVPDVSKWSCDQLASFVKKYFPAESHVLREQEIDGASLLLMTRSDVITGLQLKLGPAIQLYNFIIMLQTKKHDYTATWIY